MASINPAPLQTWLEGKTEIDEFICPTRSIPDVSFFTEKTESHTPFAWNYVEVPPNESRVGYNNTVTFPVGKIGDVIGPVFLYMRISKFTFGPLLDSGVVRAVRASALPDAPAGESLSGLSKLDLLPTLVDYAGFALLSSAEFYAGTNQIDITSGDYTFLNQDMGTNQDKSWVYTLPSNQGGADNVATAGDQDLYVPLDLFWTRDIRSSLRHRALQYSDATIRITLNSIPIRADALAFAQPNNDAVAQELYASINGLDILPEDMYRRYSELRADRAPITISFATAVRNAPSQLDAGFVPFVSLQFTASGGNVLTTEDAATSDNCVKLVRRTTYQFQTSGLEALRYPAFASSTSDIAFIWDYANTLAFITYTTARSAPSGSAVAASASSLRLYGSLEGTSFSRAAITITFQGPSVFRIGGVFDGDQTTHIVQDVRMGATTSSYTFDGCPPIPLAPVLPGSMFFRIDPAVLDTLTPGDSWAFSLQNAVVPLDFVISTQPWGDAVPADFFEHDPSTSTAIFDYTDQLSSAYTTSTLTLDAKTPAQVRGTALPNWLTVLDNGNVLYYHTGPNTPSPIRNALAGMILGVPSDGLNFDYLKYDPGSNVDTFTGGELLGTGVNGLFHPFFPAKSQRPPLNSLPQGFTTLPVYIYEITNDPIYNSPVYTPLLNDDGIIRFGDSSIETGGQLQKCSLVSTTFMLGEWEKREMGKLDYQQLISYTVDQQVSLSKGDHSGRRIKIEFGGPCKEIVFFFRPLTHQLDGSENQRYWDWGTGPQNDLRDFFSTCQLLVNGQPLFPSNPPPPPMFFKHTVPCMNHVSVPRQTCYTIAFAWFPDMISPSGSFNLSAVQTVELVFTYPGGQLQTDGMLSIMGRMINVYSVQHGSATNAFLQ